MALDREQRQGERADELGDRAGAVARQSELTDPDADASAIDRWINRAAEVAGVSILATIATLIFVNAVGRYAMNAPVIWAEELVIGLIPWLAMCGVFLSVRRRQVIQIEYFIERLPMAYGRAVSLFGAIASSAAFTYLAIHSYDYVNLFGGDRLDYLRIPTGWFISALAIGAAATAVAFVVDFLRPKS